MGSRRTMSRSHSDSGRSGQGNGSTGNNRPGGCSYLSNVRPENRSTLCSVIAQLTQETQPAFLTTLKSRAVSESSNVKFFCVVTGYPIPQLTWYKDDKQLDRFCGLPKYEIFRNGQTHSLHIYNCTVEDAAIYQVSASNSKGIVSCSGVLEVGVMNEFKIHQRYFAKIKQKADGRGKETDGKENQEPIRTISPERSLRKRRSTMEPFLSTPSSTEDDVNKELIPSVCEDSKVRLEEPSEEPVEEKPSTKTCTKTNNENANVGGTAKTPFVKKKIKICSRGERTPEEMRKTSSEELMEVESCKNMTERPNRATLGKLLRKKSSEALRSPESARKDKESVLKRDEKVLGKNPRMPSRLQNSPQQPSSLVTQHTADPGCVDGVLKNKTALPEKMPDQPPQKETKTKQKNPSTQSEVTQAPTWKSRNDAPVNLEPPPDRRLAAADAQPQRKPPSKGEAATNDVRLHFVAPKSPQHRQHHSKGLRESQTVLQKSHPLSFADRQSQADLVAKSSERTEAQGFKKVDSKEGNRAVVRKEKITETAVAPKIQKPEQKNDKIANEANPMVASHKDKKVSSLKPNSELQTEVETAGPYQKNPSLHEQQATDFQEIPKPVTRVVSVAELMRAQIKALESAATSPAKDISADSGSRTAVGDKSQNLDQSKITIQERTSVPDIKPSKNVDSATPREHLAQQSHLGEKISQKDRSPSSAIGSLSIECHHDVIAFPSNKYCSDPVNPQISTKGSKSVPDSIPENHVDQTSPKDHLATQSHPGNKRTFEEDPSLCPSSVIDPLSMERNRDATNNTQAGLSKECSDPMNTKEIGTQGRKSAPDGIPQNHVDRTSPKENLMTQNHLGKKRAFQDLSLCPSSVIDPLGMEANGDVTNLNNYSSVPVNSKEVETQLRKSVPDSTPKKIVDATPPNEHLVTQNNLGKSSTHQEDPSPSPSSVIDPFSIKCNEDVAVIPLAGSSKTSDPVNHKKKATQRPTSNGKSDQGKDLGLVEKFIPDIKFDAEIQQGTDKNTSQTLIRENSPVSCSQGMLKVPSTSVQGEDLSPEASPVLQKGDCDSFLTPATPQELASGARRKILTSTSKDKPEETNLPSDHQPAKEEFSPLSSTLSTSPGSDSSQRSPLLQQNNDTSPVEKRSPMLGRKNMTVVTNTSSQPSNEDIQNEKTEKDRRDPCKAPQVIRKIRSESFADAMGHLKLWCQFFNILTDSTITWYRDQLEIARIKKSAADESQVNLAIVQASSKDTGIYKCIITNDYGSDSTDFLLGPDSLAGISLRMDHSVGEEIEMAPLVFSKGLADSGVWGSKLFGRVMVHKSCIGKGCANKVWRAQVIYGLEPVFESGHTCILKAQRHIAYGGKEEHYLTDRNLDLVKQECKIQNLAREYCKIFSAEARVIENFGQPLEVIPVYLMYRPANTVPYATVEADLAGVYRKYVVVDHAGKIEMKAISEVELKCCALQHWIFQWTNGNLLITQLEGVDTKITNIGVAVKYTGYQNLQMEGKPQIFEGFVSQHQCNYFCGLLGLRSLKLLDSLMAPAKPKGSRSPLLQRKSQAPGSCSPQAGRRVTGSPRMPRKAEQDAPKCLKATVEV
ncbi:alpha-protein kinase 3 [Syngnathus acus]|uniref:alpha-protein kinase 3 n=1 Tax=Syngnathus acus TaxID=161584 RepID=UPI0018860EB7|nr:alpha-protein kinase 3 [Syngnathus acus]